MQSKIIGRIEYVLYFCVFLALLCIIVFKVFCPSMQMLHKQSSITNSQFRSQ